MHKHLHLVAGLQTVGHESGAHAAALAVVGRVAHRTHAEGYLAGHGIRAGGNGVQTRGNLAEDAHKGGCIRESGFAGGAGSEVEQVAAPAEIFEGFLIGQNTGQFLAVRHGVPLGQVALLQVGDIVGADERLAQRSRFATGRGHFGCWVKPESCNQGIHQGRIVAGNHTQGITCGVGQSGTLQGVIHVDGFLGAAGFGNRADSQHRGRERVLHAVRFHCSEKNILLLTNNLPDWW